MAPVIAGQARPGHRARLGLGAEQARTVVYALLVLFWFTLPWEGVIKLGGTATIAKAVGAVLALGAVVAVLMAGRRHRPGEYVVLMVVFGGWVVASSAWTVAPGATDQRIVTMLQLVVMVLVTWEFGHSRRKVEGLMAAWVAGCVVVGLVTMWAWLHGQSEVRYTAPGTSPGDVAYSLLVGIPLAWYLSLRTHRPGLVWAYRLFVPFACLGTILTASRAGLLSMGLALLIIPVTFGGLRPRGRLVVVLAAVAAVFAALTLVASDSGPIKRLSTTSAELSGGTLDNRTTLWKIAFGLISDHPVLGLGAGGSKSAVSGQFFVSRGLHNAFLSVAVELGLVGLALFLLLGFTAVYRALTRLPWLETRLAWVLTVVFVVSLMPRHADYFKSTYAIFALIALMGVTMVRPVRPTPARPRAGRRARR